MDNYLVLLLSRLILKSLYLIFFFFSSSLKLNHVDIFLT